MGALLEAQAPNTPASGLTHTFTLNGIQAGEFIALPFSVRDGNTISSVVGTLNGAYTARAVQGGTKKAAIYFFRNSAAGNETITVTTALADIVSGVITRWSGMKTGADVVDQTNGVNNGSGLSHPHGSITTTGAGIIITAGVLAGTFTRTPNADFTALTDAGAVNRGYFQYRIITGVVTTDGAFTSSANSTSSCCIASFLEEPAAGGGYQFLNDFWW